ncbi:MAG: ATP-dependent Clp protease proteolytic subunit [Lachnospiraceae bacterium]|nr:ATP-dependent Clp protease proteolytic subunit [Lachnospiraceae bacterium]
MPNIIYESVRGITPISIDDVMLRNRKIFLVGDVSETSCNELIKELLYLESEDNTQPITLFINSPGGSVRDGLGVYDTIRLLKSPVTAVVTGIAASMGSIILLACDPKRRFMLPSASVMIHDASFGKMDVGGMKPHEIQHEVDMLNQTNERLISIIAERTGKSKDQVSEVTKHDAYFNADEAIEFGLASAVIGPEQLSNLI